MAPARRRENRENQFYDVGVQGRKTGITLEDRGVRDEHGLEPISGIFSSPEKSPPKRVTSGTITGSESMDIVESPLPQPATSTKLLRSARTHLPPPKARSPMKTTLGSSPRRQSSMGPQAQSNLPTSPSRSASHPIINRRLDFEQDESSLQETPALSGSGQRRGQRRSVYSIEPSPSRIMSTMMEESIQEEIVAGEDSAMLNGVGEESELLDIGNDTVLGAEAEADADTEPEVDVHEDGEVSADVEESEVVPEFVKLPSKRVRKRKNAAVEPAEAEEKAPQPRKRGPKPLAPGESRKKDKNAAAVPDVRPRRSKRVSDITEQEPTSLQDASAGAVEEVETPPVAAKPRGRPPKSKAQPEMPPPAKKQKRQEKEKEKEPEKENEEPVFKKPTTVPKSKKKASPKSNEAQSDKEAGESGKLVDMFLKPLSKTDLDQMSTTTAGTRLGRGRHLSVFREIEPDSAGTVGRSGRHRVKPMDFWVNDFVSYDPRGNMQAVVKNVLQERPPKQHRKSSRPKGKQRSLSAVEEEEEEEIEPWEVVGDGQFEGQYRGYDAANKISTNELLNTTIAWSQKGIKPKELADGSFKFLKLASGHAAEDNQTFMSWGFIELDADQMKRAKNASSMHLVFHIESGAVEVKVHENILTLRRGGVFQVPRGNMYSIKNVGTRTSRIFYAQGCEMRVHAEE